MFSLKTLKLPRNIYLLGLLSFFNDLSADMITPFLPLYLASMGKGSIFIGWMEGCANFLSYATMLFSGWYTDKFGNSKRTTLIGYGFCAFIRPLLAIPLSGLIFTVRILDRIGKGIRTSPRDFLLTTSLEKQDWGKAFGVQRAMDHMGALFAPAAAWILLSFSISLPTLFLVASIPAILSLFIIPRFIQVAKEKPTTPLPWPTLKSLPRSLKIYLILIFFAGLSTPSELFLILKLNELGMSSLQIPWAWFTLTVLAILAAYGGGILADHWGKRSTIALGWSLFALTYLCLALTHSLNISIWFLIALFGFQIGLVEAAERAYPASLVSEKTRATSMGFYAFAYGCGLLPGSILFGWIWKHWGSSSAFYLFAALSLILIPFLSLLPSSQQKIQTS